MNAQEIANEIVKLVNHRGAPYERWTVGVTDSPGQRRSRHEQDGKDMSWWHAWNADTGQAARDVERHFLNKGMQGGTGGQGNADHVYVF